MTPAASWMRRTGLWAKAAPVFLAALAQPASAQPLILPEGMAIQLETRHDISSKSAHAGDKVELAVAKAVTIGGVTLIPVGSPATGEVVRVRDNGLLGRSGKLDIRVDRVSVGQLEVPVRGQRNAKGKSGTLGAVGAGIVFLPLAVIVRGKDVKLPAGTKLDVYVDREITFPSDASPGASGDPLGSDPHAAPTTIRTVDPNQALVP